MKKNIAIISLSLIGIFLGVFLQIYFSKESFEVSKVSPQILNIKTPIQEFQAAYFLDGGSKAYY